jgi:hypothetical protein
LQLVAEGKLGLDDPVEKWLPHLVPNGQPLRVLRLGNGDANRQPHRRAADERRPEPGPFSDAPATHSAKRLSMASARASTNARISSYARA